MASKAQMADRASRRMRRAMDRLLDRQILMPVRRLWDREVDKLMRKVRQGRGRSGTTASMADAHQMRIVAQRGLTEMLEQIGHQMSHGTTETLTEGVRALADFMGTMRELPGPLDDPTKARAIIDQHRFRLAEMRHRSVAAIAPAMDAKIAQHMADMQPSMVTIGDLHQAIGDVADHSWGNIERVVRTECAHGFNTAQVEGILLLEDEHPQIMKRWTEMVDDRTGQPFDKRVADDSLAMHGQLATPSGVFTMRAHPKAPAKMLGQSWEYPPNRPNDRAVCTPWMPEWGQRGWVWQGGSRMYLPSGAVLPQGHADAPPPHG